MAVLLVSATIGSTFLIPDDQAWVDMGHEKDLNLCHFEKLLAMQQNLEQLDKFIETHAQEQENT